MQIGGSKGQFGHFNHGVWKRLNFKIFLAPQNIWKNINFKKFLAKIFGKIYLEKAKL